jgi:hypothetical protein
MKVLLNPFKLTWRIVLTGFRLMGFTLTFFMEIVGHLYFGRRDKIVDALGFYGREVTEALTDMFWE